MAETATEGWASFAIRALKSLGGLAPVVIVSALAVAALWKFQEQSQTNFDNLHARAESERKSSREDFEVANKALKESYGHVAKLIKGHVDALSASVQLNNEINDRLRNNLEDAHRAAIEVALANARTKQAETEAKAAFEKALEVETRAETLAEEMKATRAELDAATKRRDDANIDLVAKSNKLAELNNVLDMANRDLEARKASATAAARELADLRASLAELRLEAENNPALAAIAEKATARLTGPVAVLSSFSNAPQDMKTEDFGPLIGLTRDEIVKLVRAQENYV